MKTADRKRLWGLSGGICSYKGCATELAKQTKTSKVMGDEAHIKGENPGSPRYDSMQSEEERQSYDNMILLCPNHHREIDGDEVAWPVMKLLKMKVEHENQIKRNRNHPELIVLAGT